jgi:hypothetical protein
VSSIFALRTSFTCRYLSCNSSVGGKAVDGLSCVLPRKDLVSAGVSTAVVIMRSAISLTLCLF